MNISYLGFGNKTIMENDSFDPKNYFDIDE